MKHLGVTLNVIVDIKHKLLFWTSPKIKTPHIKYRFLIIILVHAYSTTSFLFDVDALAFILWFIFSQYGTNNKLHPIAFYSQKDLATKINYKIHGKELLAIFYAFEE